MTTRFRGTHCGGGGGTVMLGLFAKPIFLEVGGGAALLTTPVIITGTSKSSRVRVLMSLLSHLILITQLNVH